LGQPLLFRCVPLLGGFTLLGVCQLAGAETVVSVSKESVPVANAEPESPSAEISEKNQEKGQFLETEFEGLEELSLVDLMSINVTTATKSSSKIDEAPAVISVISRKKIDAYGYRNVCEVLATIPGIYATDDLVTCNVGVRGIGGGADSWSRIVKVMIDGHPANYHTTGGYLLGPEFVPMDSIESIEVIRGPGSALYGANAFLGVINIKTITPNDGVEGLLRAEAGVVATNNPGGGGAGRLTFGMGDKFYFSGLLSMQGERYDRAGLVVPSSSPDVESISPSVSARDVTSPMSSFGKFSLETPHAGVISLSGFYQRLDTQSSFVSLDPLSENTRYSQRNMQARADYELPLVNNSFVLHGFGAFTYGYSADEEEFEPTAPANYQFHRYRKSEAVEAGLELTYDFFGRNQVLLGGDLLALDDAGDPVVERSSDGSEAQRIDNGPVKYLNLGSFVQVVAYPLDAVAVPLSFIGTLRLDSNDNWGDNITWRTALVYPLHEAVALKGMYGTSFVPPAPTQLAATPLNLRGGVAGNRALKSQTADTAELHAVVRPLRNLEFELTGFYTLVEDRIEQLPAGARLMAQNVTQSETVGFELSGRTQWGALQFEADFSFNHTVVADPVPLPFSWSFTYGDDVPGKRASPNMPPVMGHLRAHWAMPRYFFAFAPSLGFFGKRKSSGANSQINRGAYMLNDYMQLDFHLRTLELEFIPYKKTEFSLHVNNLLNSNYAVGGINGVDIPNLGRAFYLRASQEF